MGPLQRGVVSSFACVRCDARQRGAEKSEGRRLVGEGTERGRCMVRVRTMLAKIQGGPASGTRLPIFN